MAFAMFQSRATLRHPVLIRLREEPSEANKEKILMELNEYLTENRDRQLFDLPNIEEN